MRLKQKPDPPRDGSGLRGTTLVGRPPCSASPLTPTARFTRAIGFPITEGLRPRLPVRLRRTFPWAAREGTSAGFIRGQVPVSACPSLAAPASLLSSVTAVTCAYYPSLRRDVKGGNKLVVGHGVSHGARLLSGRKSKYLGEACSCPLATSGMISLLPTLQDSSRRHPVKKPFLPLRSRAGCSAAYRWRDPNCPRVPIRPCAWPQVLYSAGFPAHINRLANSRQGQRTHFRLHRITLGT